MEKPLKDNENLNNRKALKEGGKMESKMFESCISFNRKTEDFQKPDINIERMVTEND